ncbi:hypothetical protein AGDE_02845 [Angomonas deanei]|uniref:Uncharacterized protein n=1 Tax=Angomonas deanei TaxID=59799 RepID=A0A7G2CGF2_9TRYP|nr:hypothetical protein AGDE_02845 [Angomonas deanei]CAD2218968.1 hypothetical protein, conserved [Angomonas deanei]|eukprot:EPY41080.1 hypothetical protein AGDE_02845 [Angomonas deanei]
MQSRRSVSEPEKSTDQLEVDVKRLEALLEQRNEEYNTLLNTADTEEKAPASSIEDVVAEINELTAKNNRMKRDLKSVADLERQYATDPRVIDKRNEVRAVQIEAEKHETELYTLQTLKKRRDKGLREINVSEERARKAKRQQNEIKAEAREQIKELEAELRVLLSDDLQVREQLASLQEKLKAGVSVEQQEELSDKVRDQERTIKDLKMQEEELKQRRSDMRDEGQSNITRQRRELQRLEDEVENLKQVLVQRENEHKRSYQNNFNNNDKYYVA